MSPDARRPRHWLATGALGAVIVAGVLVVAGVVVGRGVLLDPGTYRGALAEADAYERAYTEVLSDPQLAELTELLIGGITRPDLPAATMRILATNAVRWTVPPSTLQHAAEALIDATLGYVRGDLDRLVVDIDVSAVLERVDDTALVAARTALADTVDRAVSSVAAYRGAVDALLDELAAGRVPEGIPVLGGTEFEPDEIVDVIVEALGPRVDEATLRRITAAVLAGDERDALIDAAATQVADHAAAASAALRSSADDRRFLDVVAELADRAERPATEIVGVLDGVRESARWARPWVAVLAAAVVAAAVAALLWLHRTDLVRGGYVLAAVAAVSAAALMAAWWLVSAATAEPLARATGTGPGAWNLPPGLRGVLVDVEASIADELARPVRAMALLLLGAAALVAGAAALGPRLQAFAARTSGRTVVASGIAAAAVAALLVVVVVSVTAPQLAAAEARLCNGHVELCDRPYDEVVYAATHNSMSSPDVVDVWPEHDGNIAAQLDAGVRALLIDTHYWTAVTSPRVLADAEPLLPQQLVDVLYRTVGERARARDGTWLCHAHCAFGGVPLVDSLVTVREFLDANPGDVVTLIIQDEITVADTEPAVREAGLEPYLHIHADGDDWPTLDEMIDDGERLVVLAENQGPPPPWYHQGFELMQETPFLFREPERFSCAPNRGNPDATLFQLNHWVQRIAPDRVDSALVNTHDALVARARQCQAERGLIPNFLAVNHYNIGDLMAAVDTLNGVT